MNVNFQNNKLIQDLREQNDQIMKEKMQRDTSNKELNISSDIQGIQAPQNVNLLPFMDDARSQIRRDYIKNLTLENKSLDIEK
jgi:hypothetical protein